MMTTPSAQARIAKMQALRKIVLRFERVRNSLAAIEKMTIIRTSKSRTPMTLFLRITTLQFRLGA
jgi:hypothetical protein